jgi:malonyl CoA-acyl carrier protein transacylase
MFPGQPVSFSDPSANEPEFLEINRLCQDVTGCDPTEESVSDSEFSESLRLQLFGTCASLYRLNQPRKQGIVPDVIAEHSMGIYAALAAAGSIDDATALALTYRFGAAMMEMAGEREFALGCVIGLAVEPLKLIAESFDVHIANHNTSRHFLLAGERSCIDSALAGATAAGAFSVSMFNCDAPLHSPLIGELSGRLHKIVAEYTFGEPRYPLVEHFAQTTLTAATIPVFLVDELTLPVYWEATYRNLRSRGVTAFTEVGAGTALSKFNRWIDSEL